MVIEMTFPKAGIFSGRTKRLDLRHIFRPARGA